MVFATGNSTRTSTNFEGTQQSSPAPNYYIEMLGMTLRENFTALSVNFTAIRQCTAEGDGPGYLLNGLSDTGYWYQVGLASNWGYPGQSWLPGFVAIYAVFAPNRTQIFPQGGGVVWKSMPVSESDAVSLKMYMSGGNVVMQVLDSARGLSNSTSYTAAGATRFVGSPNGDTGYFTGLMTEEWHSTPYYGDERRVDYAWNGLSLSTAWNWIGEFNDTTNKWLFYNRSFANYTGRPQIQYLRSNGTVVGSNSQTFVSGSLSTGQNCPIDPSPPPTTPRPPIWQTSAFLVLTIALTFTIVAVTVMAWRRRGRKKALAGNPRPATTI